MNKTVKECIKLDEQLYLPQNFVKKLYFHLTKNQNIIFFKYIKYCRKYNYYNKEKKSVFFKLFYAYRKNKYGMKYNLDIGCENIGKSLKIYHSNIVINPKAVIGDGCLLHGNNCIGNKNKQDDCPKIGNGVDIGFGATLIGNIYIADNVKIGANSVVTKSFYEKNCVIAGNPAKIIKVQGSE